MSQLPLEGLLTWAQREPGRTDYKLATKGTKGMMDAVAATLDDAWGPRCLKGWCEAFALRFFLRPRCPRVGGAAAVHLSGPIAHATNLLNTRPPPRYSS